MAMFDRMDKVISKAVDRVNAISFVFTPMESTPNGRYSQDTTRRLSVAPVYSIISQSNTACSSACVDPTVRRTTCVRSSLVETRSCRLTDVISRSELKNRDKATR